VQVERANDGVARINDESIRKLSIINPQVVQEFEEAKKAVEKEHELTVRDALKLYPKAIIFSIIFSSAVIMEGYDLSLMGSFFGFPVSDTLALPRSSTLSLITMQPFRNFYGTEDNPDGGRNIGAAWQSGIQNGVQVGSIIGLWLNGIVSDKFGYRKVSAVKPLDYGEILSR